MTYDVMIVGGGPAGLAAALTLGRARKNVLLCDSGPRRNRLAEHIHNFVTRDGTTPDEFRDVARQQLTRYPNVEHRGVHIESITGARGAFTLRAANDVFEARRVVLCVGMVDQPPALEGFRELWGHVIFQCPYCHGWEVRERHWGYIAESAAALNFAILLRGWSQRVTVFTSGAFEVPTEFSAQLQTSGVQLRTDPIARLQRRGHELSGVELANGETVPCEILFAHPVQRHVDLVASLPIGLDGEGFVRVDAMTRETSMPGVYAAGDLTTRAQGAIFAAAMGAQAAGMLNHELTAELVSNSSFDSRRNAYG